MLDILVLVLFAVVCIWGLNYRKKINSGISVNKKTAIGRTVYCNKNIRSSMHTLHYQFIYKNKVYSGTTQFDKRKRGNICTGINFLIEFDSTRPENNRIILDSLVK
jgi:hypothetical protein